MNEMTCCSVEWGWFLRLAIVLATALFGGYYLGLGRTKTKEKKEKQQTAADNPLCSQEYAFAFLDKLSVAGRWQVDVNCSAPENFCRITADSGVIDAVKVEQSTGAIRIRYTGKKYPQNPPRLEVGTTKLIPALKSCGKSTVHCRNISGESLSVKIADGTRIMLDDMALETFTLKCSDRSTAECTGSAGRCGAKIDGGSTTVLNGKFQRLEADVSGASELEVDAAEKAELEVSGAGRVKIRAAKKLSGSVSGASTVKYSGSVPKADFRISGSSRVKRQENE